MMFSGQGSQYYQMGKSLFAANKTFRDWMLKGDRICQDLIGLSITNHLYDVQIPRSQPFTKTLLSHPAIFMFEYGLIQILLEKNIYPNFVLGTSMGEFAAAVTCGILSFDSALESLIKQAQALENCAEGGMLAILHSSDLYHSQDYLNQFSELAAINFPANFVVSGQQDHLKIIRNKLKEKNILSQMLPVSHAFHSSLIDEAKTPFLNSIQQLKLENPKIPFISCADAKNLISVSHNHFWKIIRSPILFENVIQDLEKQQAVLYLDVGPSGTLANFVKYNLSSTSQSKQLALLTPFGDEIKNLENALNSILE